MEVFEHIENMSQNQFNIMPVGSLVTRLANYTTSMSDLFTNVLASAQTIQPREVLIPVIVNGVPKIKKVQAICGEGYGSSNTIDFRTVRVIVDDNGTLKAQQASVLCTAPSGDMSEVGGGGGGNPTAPAHYVTLGSAAEGADTADSASWTAGATDSNQNLLGVKVWVVSREVYNAGGDQILYFFARLWTFDAFGRLYSVSGESRVIVDETVAIPTSDY